MRFENRLFGIASQISAHFKFMERKMIVMIGRFLSAKVIYFGKLYSLNVIWMVHGGVKVVHFSFKINGGLIFFWNARWSFSKGITLYSHFGWKFTERKKLWYWNGFSVGLMHSVQLNIASSFALIFLRLYIWSPWDVSAAPSTLAKTMVGSMLVEYPITWIPIGPWKTHT